MSHGVPVEDKCDVCHLRKPALAAEQPLPPAPPSDLNNEIRELLHDFGTTYRVLTKDERQADLAAATQALLTLLDSYLPEEKDNEHNLGDYYASDIPEIEKDAIAAIYEVAGYNQAIQDVKSIIAKAKRSL